MEATGKFVRSNLKLFFLEQTSSNNKLMTKELKTRFPMALKIWKIDQIKFLMKHGLNLPSRNND
jgi:hypothetical protein